MCRTKFYFYVTNFIMVLLVLLGTSSTASASSHQSDVNPIVVIAIPLVFVLIMGILGYKYWWIPKNELGGVRSDIAQAITMTNSTVPAKRREARVIFENILDQPAVDGHASLLAGLSLSEYKIMELKLEPTENKVQEFVDLFEDLSKIASQFYLHKYSYHLELLLAKFKLILGEKNDAQLHIAKAELINSERHLDAAEHLKGQKNLLLENKELEEALSSNQTIKHLAEMVEAHDHIVALIDELKQEVPGVSSEIPVTLLIMNNQGTTLFSMKFLFGLIVDDQLFGGFLTAINSFSKEVFSQEGNINTFSGELDYIKYGQFTLILKPEKNFLFCYVIKGQSDTAPQKLTKLTNNIKNDEQIWTALQSFEETREITKDTEVQIENQIESVFFS